MHPPFTYLFLDFQTEAAPAEVKKDDAPKSPGLLAKLLAPFKNDKKVKAPKKDKKEKEEAKVETDVVSCRPRWLTYTFIFSPRLPLSLLRPRMLLRSMLPKLRRPRPLVKQRRNRESLCHSSLISPSYSYI
jgi:hypothetical protein